MLHIVLSVVLSTAHAALPAPIADAVALGDCTPVLAAVPQPATDDARLAVGWCLRRQDPHRAIEVLAPLTSGVLAEYGRWVRAETQLHAGDAAAALASLEGLTLPERPGLAVRLLRARALLALGRSLDARPDLRALLSTSVGAEARMLLADGAVDRGDVGPAITTYQAVWARSTRGPWSGAAAEALATLGAAVPDFDTDEGRALIRRRIDALEDDHQYGDALDLRLELRRRAGDTAVTQALGRAYFRGRRYADAVATWRSTLGEPAVAVGEPSELFDFALATSRTGDYDTAAVIYRRVMTLHATSRQADEASFKLGYLHYDSGRCDLAIPELAAHLDRYPQTRHAESARWFLARCQWKQGDHEAAGRTLDALASASPRSDLVAGARYWQARLHGMSGDAARERAGLEAVIDRWPTSGHAWLAAEALHRTFPLKPTVSRPAWPDALARRSDVQRAEALLGAGFRSWAGAELADISGPARAAGRDGALAAAHALIAAGRARPAKDLARPYCTSPWNDGDPIAQQACTPRLEASLVTRAATERQLHPLLPYAIMVAESAMDPSVTSLAGARGLMQVMPAEGERLHAAALGAGAYDPDDLYRATYNALLGTTELGLKRASLEGTLDGDVLPAVIASYNGGEAAVRRWLTAWPDGPAPVDAFMEDIGYTETRQYVRRVLGTLMAYRWVYGDPPQR